MLEKAPYPTGRKKKFHPWVMTHRFEYAVVALFGGQAQFSAPRSGSPSGEFKLELRLSDRRLHGGSFEGFAWMGEAGAPEGAAPTARAVV